LGGYNNLGLSDYVYKNFKDIPTHSYLRIQVKVWQIDSWDIKYDNDKFYIKIDGKTVNTLQREIRRDGTAMCG